MMSSINPTTQAAANAIAAVNPQAASQSALASMKDIQLPEPISFWPLATGYWLVLAVMIALLAWAIIALVKRKKRLAPQKAALALLRNLDPQSPHIASDVNALLKRVALSHLPRSQVASLDGKAWHTWLDKAMPTAHRGVLGPLLDKRYHAGGLTPDDGTQLIKLSEIWLKHTAHLHQSVVEGASHQEVKC